MRNISSEFKDHLAGTVTTLCWLWKITRRDGLVLGFTNHDRVLDVDGVSYEAASSLTSAETDSRLGFAANNGAVQGVLNSERIKPADIKSGLYEQAVLDTYRVNWRAPDQIVHMASGLLGSIRQSGDTFEAEWVGKSVLLDRSFLQEHPALAHAKPVRHNLIILSTSGGSHFYLEMTHYKPRRKEVTFATGVRVINDPIEYPRLCPKGSDSNHGL